MLPPNQVEELLCLVATLGRTALTELLLNFEGPFPVDFTPEFVSKLSVERMRHIYCALCLQSEKMPETAELMAV